jgi:hypothetical protein
VRPVNERQAERFAGEPELISIKATQALLGDVGDKTIRRLVKAGRMEAVKWAPVLCRVSPRSAASPEADHALARRPFRQFRSKRASFRATGAARPCERRR